VHARQEQEDARQGVQREREHSAHAVEACEHARVPLAVCVRPAVERVEVSRHEAAATAVVVEREAVEAHEEDLQPLYAVREGAVVAQRRILGRD
jgi:hypothetical protein